MCMKPKYINGWKYKIEKYKIIFIGLFVVLLLNDSLMIFSTPGLVNSFGFVPNEANFIVPGKRPLSSMSPIIIVDNNNQVRLVLGASGGSKIVSAVSQVYIYILNYKNQYTGSLFFFFFFQTLNANLFLAI